MSVVGLAAIGAGLCFTFWMALRGPRLVTGGSAVRTMFRTFGSGTRAPGRVLAIALATALVAACSGSATPAGGSTAGAGATTPAGAGATAPTGGGSSINGKVVADVCSLLTPAEMKAQLGVDFPPGKVPEVSGSTATCEWQTPAGQSSALVSLSVEQFDQGQWNIAKKLNGARPQSGLGDDALFGFVDVLYVKKGDRDFTIQVVMMPAPSGSLDEAKIELAKLVLSRL
jgi:hypothetical protein